MKWAKLPMAWMALPPSTAGSEPPRSPLHLFGWRGNGGAGIGALLVLISLTIQLNKTQPREKGSERKTRVQTSYNTLEDMTGLSKQTIAKALNILEGLGAIKVHRLGRANEYELVGLEEAGAWRKLPQAALLQGDVLVLKDLQRSRKSFNALKIYFAMIYLYNDTYGTTSISYGAIERWTGVRKTEIRDALGLLSVYQLVRPSNERDPRHSTTGDNDQSARYELRGLSYHWSGTPPWVTPSPPPSHIQITDYAATLHEPHAS